MTRVAASHGTRLTEELGPPALCRGRRAGALGCFAGVRRRHRASGGSREGSICSHH